MTARTVKPSDILEINSLSIAKGLTTSVLYYGAFPMNVKVSCEVHGQFFPN